MNDLEQQFKDKVEELDQAIRHRDRLIVRLREAKQAVVDMQKELAKGLPYEAGDKVEVEFSAKAEGTKILYVRAVNLVYSIQSKKFTLNLTFYKVKKNGDPSLLKYDYGFQKRVGSHILSIKKIS